MSYSHSPHAHTGLESSGDSRRNKKTKTRYHHGNLRQALVDAAIEQVRKAGPEGLSLRSLALSIGVTTNAPYRHFLDLEAILGEVTAHGIELLHGRNRAAMESAADPGQALRQMAQAWLDFAEEEEQLMRLAGDLSRLRDAEEGSQLAASQPLLWHDVVDAFRALHPE